VTRRKPPPSESGAFTVSMVSGDVLRLSPDRCEAQIGQRYITLTDQECSLLRALIEEREQVVTRTALMTAVWGKASPDRIALLENAIDRLRERLGTQVKIETVTGIGYRLL
jgi:two-component system, OmpR family, response regulator